MRYARLLQGLLLLAISASVVSPAIAQPPQKRQLGEKYALLIAVRDYDRTELKNLRYSEADILALARVLQDAGYRRVVLLTQTEGAKRSRFLPMQAHIRKELKGLLEDCTEEDSVVVAFAGHGVQFRGKEENYFCPMDAKLTDKRTLIVLSEVYQEMGRCKAGFKLLLVDACRNDPQSDESRSRAEVQLESV